MVGIEPLLLGRFFANVTGIRFQLQLSLEANKIFSSVTVARPKIISMLIFQLGEDQAERPQYTY